MTIRRVGTPQEETARKERLRRSSRECSCGMLRMWGHACLDGHMRMTIEEFSELLCRSIANWTPEERAQARKKLQESL